MSHTVPASVLPTLPAMPVQPTAKTRETLPQAPARLHMTATRVPVEHKTADYIFETDLDTLLAEYDARIVFAPEDTDPKFFAGSVIRDSGIFLLLSPHLCEYERDFFPRYLICQALGHDLTPLPTPFAVEINPLLPGVPA
ncbi:hypothetical protein [Streptomyces erythrochromogenes]|uniref:hypothetical protein n=1 Tax=Streptomyces erythrochromogenes TaxID=285574 RepID=UPI00225A6D6A|nr:hypothetical protein [Streptomyces erythrochromogenes]MCX5586048.1 hypothetical protein [Streptomyces erythrochromogenes]